MNNILLTSFKYKNKEYLYFLDDDKIIYKVKTNDRITDNLSKDERLLMGRVLSKILLSNNYNNTYNISKVVLDEDFNITIDKVMNHLKVIEKCFIGMLTGSILSFIAQYIVLPNVLPYSNKKIVKTIDQNEDITTEEAKYLKECLVILDDNKEYVNQWLVNKKMKNLDIKYDYNFEGKDNTLGYFNSSNNFISIREEENLNEEHILTHEILHSFSSNDIELGKALDEAITEQLTVEYLGEEYDNTYYNIRIYMAALCEIIGTDALKEYYFKGNIFAIINELDKIDNNPIKAYKLLNNIDKYCEYYYSDESINKINDVKEEIYDSLDDYFYKKYNSHITDDYIMTNLLINTGLYNKESNISFDNIIYPYIGGYFTKSYFDKNGTTGYYSYVNNKLSKQGIISNRTIPKNDDNAEEFTLKYIPHSN